MNNKLNPVVRYTERELLKKKKKTKKTLLEAVLCMNTGDIFMRSVD